MSCDYWLVYLAGLLASLSATQGETDIYHYKDVIRGEIPESLFGYSIAYQEKLKKLVIGAPIEDPIGQVHLCPIEKAGKCEQVYCDNIKIDDKHSYWFGATVNAGNNFFMTCAPRFNTVSRKHSSFRSTYGHCYYADIENESKPSKENPMKEFTYVITDEDRGAYHKLAYGEETNYSMPEQLTDTFGMSSYVYDKKVIYVGGPFMSIGRVYQYGENNNKIISVDNKKLGKKVSYNFGYSITSGYFLSNRKKETIAISTPYGTTGYGRVYFYEKDALMNDVWVDGEEVVKVGSLFGASLASLTIGYKESVLLVGAPAFTNTSSGYDVGAVFIYTFKRLGFRKMRTDLNKTVLPFSDETVGGRFGAAIVSIGDFNKDNIPEVAIAAPLEHDGRGAVYLYSGKLLLSRNSGSRVPYMQLLQPEALMLSYGWSLTVPNDADENGCNELAIGAPFSDSVTFMRCIASVEINLLNITFPDLAVQYSDLAHDDTAFTFSTCLKIQYNEKPKPANIETNAHFTIKVIHPDVKLESGDNNGTTKAITKQLDNKDGVLKLICLDHKVLLPKEADYDQEIMFNVSANLVENPLNRSEFNPNLVLLNDGTSYFKLFPGPEMPASNVEFKVQTTIQENYVIGSTSDAQLVIFMKNSGQTAHGPCVRTRLNGITVSQMPTDRTCSVANGELICKLEKLRSGQNQTILIMLSMKSLTSANDSLELYSESFTSDCRIPTERNQSITINLTKDANVIIKNSSIPSFNVNATKEELDSTGKIIEHVYKIINNGFTVWKNVSCEIVLPTQVNIEKVTIKLNKPGIENCVVMEHKAYCHIPELGKNKPIDIRIQMKIIPGSDFGEQIKSGKATVDTELSLTLLDTMLLRITTIVTLWEAPKVPLWMIIVASLVGILIIVILLWVLHECGCLRRQNKQKLRDLQRDVKRQTVRKSMMLRQSVIEVVKKGEQERLIDVAEEDTCSNGFEHADHQNTSKDKDMNGQLAKEKPNVQQTQQRTSLSKDKIDVHQTQEATDLINVQPVKEICVDDNDPARVVFNAELAKALAKGGNTVGTKADIH